MSPGLAQTVEAMALRAERLQQAQTVPARLLREVAEALLDLAYVAAHGGGAEQAWARDGRPASRRSEARDEAPPAVSETFPHGGST